MFKQKTKNVTKVEWIILAVFFLTFFCIYLYHDICHTTSRGITFWECLFNGRLRDFYAYQYSGVEGSFLPDGTYGGAYDILFYIIFALWDFPLWIFEKITHTSFLSVYGGRLYAKCIVLVFLGISAWILREIALMLTKNKELSNWGVFLFISSSMTVSAIVVQGGYDIISVCFSLLGIYFYLQDEDWKFVWSFAIAATCKMFALFVFVPLVLLKHKQIWGIIERGIVSISLIAVPKILTMIGNYVSNRFGNSNLSEAITFIQTDILLASTDGDGAISSNSLIAHSNIVDKQMFAGNDAAISFGQLPLFFLMTFLFWWICWKKEQVTQYEVIYYCLVSVSIFMLFVRINPYWIILLVPYVILTMVTNIDKMRDNVILDIIFSVGFILYLVYRYSWCYSFDMFTVMTGIDSQIPGNYEVCGVVNILERLQVSTGVSVEHIVSVFMACFVLGLVLFLYENRPGTQCLIKVDFEQIRHLAWIRTIPALGIAFFPLTIAIFYYLITIF